MVAYKLSEIADQKITEIYEFSILNFGEKQADKYYFSLHNTLKLLAEQPELGRVYYDFRRHEHEKHVIFYTIKPFGVFVIDILHERESIMGKIENSDMNT